MENKDFTDNMMNLLNEIEKQPPNDDFIKRMQKEARAKYGSPMVVRFNLRSILGLVASFLLLFMINIYAINKSNQEKTYINNTPESVYNLLAIQTLYDE